jgi:hypothetical protein
MMSKAIGVFAMMALIIALIGMWLRFAPVTTEAVTAAEVQPLSNPISPFALTPENGQSLPDGYPGRLYARLSQSMSEGRGGVAGEFSDGNYIRAS